ncbi:hypothetical protein ACQKCJ_02475 [Flavobacterium sp. NPDC079362]|nr:hypothetical protein [Flavobacterium azizsancarii]
MTKINNLKILVVGLTTVLALTSFTGNDFKNNIVKNKYSNFNQVG